MMWWWSTYNAARGIRGGKPAEFGLVSLSLTKSSFIFSFTCFKEYSFVCNQVSLAIICPTPMKYANICNFGMEKIILFRSRLDEGAGPSWPEVTIGKMLNSLSLLQNDAIPSRLSSKYFESRWWSGNVTRRTKLQIIYDFTGRIFPFQGCQSWRGRNSPLAVHTRLL